MPGSRKTRLSPFAAAVGATCRSRRLLGSEDRVLAALSGGADSTALVSSLVELREAGELARVTALHVDHGLRPGSAQDGIFCETLCRRLGVPFEQVSVRVASGNVQAQARRARYAALRDAALRVSATRIATGHTRTDQAETVLLRLLRGSGARGLSGIPPRRGSLVRPLLDRSRAEVVAYLRDRGLPWHEDPTNATPRFLRNRVRREVVPLLEALNPSVEEALARTADLLRDDERALARRGRRAVEGSAVIRLEPLLAEPVAVRRRAIRALWRCARGRRTDLGARHVDAILALCRRTRPGAVTLPRGFEARCRYGRLSIGPVRRAAPPEVGELPLPGPGTYPLPGRTMRLEIRARPGAGPGDVIWPLTLRTRRPGDRFRPEGGRGSKKLKGWLIDRKVPREDRDALLVLANRKGEVLLLPDLGLRAANPALEFRLIHEEKA